MKTNPDQNRLAFQRGLSLVEITLVIGLMLLLASVITYSLSSMGDWKKGKAASEQLKSIYLAQKSYLADHPTEDSSDLTDAKIIPYLPGRPGEMPAGESLQNEALVADVTVMPPVFELDGSAYDPSDAPDDGLWDTGGL